MGGPPARSPGRSHEASGNARPRWMVAAPARVYRIRLIGPLRGPGPGPERGRVHLVRSVNRSGYLLAGSGYRSAR
jgi:hypothetical protein